MLKDKLNISTVDIDLYRNHIYNKDKIKSLDVNSRFKRFKFFYNGLLLNLENITVRAYIIKPDNKEIFNDLTIIDGNIAELEFTNQALLISGTLKLELVLYEDDAELSSFLLEYEIIKSLRSDNSIESSNEYNSLQIALQKVELWNKNYQALYDKWNNDFNILHANKSAILDNLKTTKENELNKLKIDKNNELETLHNTKKSELNKLKSDKDNELTTLYNSKDEELNTLKNTWDEEFKKKYDGLNKEYSDRVVTLEDDVLNANSSEPLLNENVTSFKVGTGTINGVAKDYTNDMEQSLVTLDNIEGKSIKVPNNVNKLHIVDQKIACVYTLDKIDNKNYFEDMSIEYPNDTVKATYINGDLNVNARGSSTEWFYVTCRVDGLTPGNVYAVQCSDVIKPDSSIGGKSAITIEGSAQVVGMLGTMVNEYQPHNSGNSLVFIAKKTTVFLYTYCTLGESAEGSVTYKNLQVRKVKNYTSPDLVLRSVPNGVKDELKDNHFIMRIEQETLTSTNYLYLQESNEGITPTVTAFRTTTGLPNCAYTGNDPYDHLVSNMASKSHNQWGEDTEGVHIGNSDNLYVYYNVNRSSYPTVQSFIQAYLPSTINYVARDYKIIPLTIEILASPGDTIYINSSIKLNCTHSVQLNTKSQIDSVQNFAIRNYRGLWHKFKDFIDVKIHPGVNGYLKLPTIFGGYIFQWGRVVIAATGQSRDASKFVSFPISFQHNIHFSSATMYVSAWQNSGTTGDGLDGLTAWIVGLDESILSAGNYHTMWFAFGR